MIGGSPAYFISRYAGSYDLEIICRPEDVQREYQQACALSI
ncbi:MAG: hypothetical protein P8185_03135 [Deltaproteobacteria bacterium]